MLRPSNNDGTQRLPNGILLLSQIIASYCQLSLFEPCSGQWSSSKRRYSDDMVVYVVDSYNDDCRYTDRYSYTSILPWAHCYCHLHMCIC